MGRVLAHERTMQHGKKGITKPVYTAAELVSDRLSFAERESMSLRSMLVPGAR